MYESGAGEQNCLRNVPIPLLPPIVEQKVAQMAEKASRTTSSAKSKRRKQVKKKTGGHDQQQAGEGDGDDSLLYNGCLIATEYQSHWLANHYPQMLHPTHSWDDERRTYEKLLDIGTKLCRDHQFEHALRCFTMAVPPNAADHAYVYALRAVVKLRSELYEDAVVDAATVMLIFLTNTMWHRLFPHFRLAFTNAHLVVAVAFSRLGYVSAAKAWADRFVCMSESLPGHDADSMLSALQLVELGDEARLLHKTNLHELADFSTIRQINAEDLQYHAQRVLVGGEKLSSVQVLFSIVHISLNYGYFLTESYPAYRDEILINDFRFHMGLLQLPIVARILSLNSAFEANDHDCQFFSILSRFLLLPMCYCLNYNVCEEMLTEPVFVGFLSTVASELAANNAAIVRYKTDKPCFALLAPVFSTILWAVWHRAPMGRSRLLAGVVPFNDISWHTEVLLAELGANGPPTAWLRLLDFFAVFYESFSVLPAFKAEIHKMTVTKLAAVINKLSWLWTALFQYSIGGCIATREPLMESLDKASSDTSLVFWLLIAKDEYFLNAMVRSQFWLHIATHMEFMTKKASRDLLAPNVRTGRLKCVIDLLIAMLQTDCRDQWPADVFTTRFFYTIARCLAELLFVGNEFSHELPAEITWLLLKLATLMAIHFDEEFPNQLASFCGQDYSNIANSLLRLLKQPPSEAIFKATVTCTAMLLRHVPEKINRACKRLKLKEVNALFAKLASTVTSLHDLDCDEIVLTSACRLLSILLANERCSAAVCEPETGALFWPIQANSTERYLVMQGDDSAVLLTPPPDNEPSVTHYDVLVRALTIFSEDIDSKKLLVSREAEVEQALSALLERLSNVKGTDGADGPMEEVTKGMSTMELKHRTPVDAE